MGVKRKCVGCGAVFDFDFGTTTICQFCGTKQYIAFNESTYERIKQANNYRESGDFDKCISIYDDLIDIYPKSEELHFGRFLAKYEVYNTDKVLKGKEIVLTVCETPTIKDNDFVLANSLDFMKKEYLDIASAIEKRRTRNVMIDRELEKNNYLAMIISNGKPNENFLATQIYEKLKHKVDLFYPKTTMSSFCDEEKIIGTLLACACVPCLYVVIEDLDNMDTLTQQIIEKFVEYNNFTRVCLITSDYKRNNYFYNNVGNVIDFVNNLEEQVLDDMILCSPIPFNDALQFKKMRKYLNDDSNPSPKVNI
ncbi:MAG: hypothetical protein IJY84_03465 [Clostridia bacterium]|nr:hypothetical protein [Clostridia bacterium]